MSHEKYRPGALVLLRQLDANGNTATIWGGQILSSTTQEMTILGIEVVYIREGWHCVGDFRKLTAPTHRLPYKWGFPRLLIPNEANEDDLKAKVVLEKAISLYHEEHAASSTNATA
jgi:hypothetical protein